MAQDVKAISSYKTFLMIDKAGSGSYEKLADIKNFPDLGSTPDKLDCTTLSDGREWGIPDIIKQGDAFTFTCNYIPSTYKAVSALNDGQDYKMALWLGGTVGEDEHVTPTGENGVFEFVGQINTRILGKGVSEVQEFEISIVPSDGPYFKENAG